MERTKGTWKKGDPLTETGTEEVERFYITGEDNRTIAIVGLWLDKIEEQTANANFICKSVNFHDRLVEIAIKWREHLLSMRLELSASQITTLLDELKELED